MSGVELFMAGMSAAGAAGSTAVAGTSAFGMGVAAAQAMPLIGLAGTAMSAYGAYQQNKALEAGYTSQAQMAEYNKKLAMMEGYAEERRRRDESRRQLGAIRAGVAKSGVTMEGTPLMVMEESAEMAEVDALSARWSGQVSSSLYGAEAASARNAAAMTKAQRPFAVGASLLSNAGTIASSARSLYTTGKSYFGSSSSAPSYSGRYSSVPNASIRAYA